MSENYLKANTIRLIPTIDNLYFYNEKDVILNREIEDKQNAIVAILKNKNQYELFLKQKIRRPNYDIYACFHPFNEATKAVYPFLKKLQSQVKKDDVILNLWDRSGWLTTLLLGLFPEQRIVTTWEGNKDVLGYKGFHFWMKDIKNLDIIFCDLNCPLPFKDNSIAFSIGIDAFHRFDQSVLIEELTRVVKDDGAILFPHVHLSNSEPEPFFERGCKQIHGKDYHEIFGRMSKNSNWEGYVFSEPKLFAENDILQSNHILLQSDPDTIDYNALIAILPKCWSGQTLSSFSAKDVSNIGQARVLVNLLLNIDLNQQSVTIDYSHFEGAVGHLLERHPIYIERIKALNNYLLSDLAIKTIYLSKLGYTINEICTQINVSQKDLVEELEHLENLGLLQVLPVSYDGFRLQHLIMSQEYLTPKKNQNIKDLWQKAVANFEDEIAIISLQDESEFTYGDCNEITKNIFKSIKNNGLKKGDKIVICSAINTEAVLLTWACLQIGIVVVPIATHLTADAVLYIIELTAPKLYFSNQASYKDNHTFINNIDVILFDEEEQEFEESYFSDWLNSDDNTNNVIQQENIQSEDVAVLLFTSGSTGMPKGVSLSHGNLFRSGALVTDTFHWGSDDRFFVLGGLESMSGLRNSTIAPLHVGASIIIPKETVANNLFSITEAISESQATVLGSNPSLLRQLVKYKDKIRGQLDSVKKLICTGNNLTESLRVDVKEAFNLSILNYYGLTETTGICISQSPIDKFLEQKTIGKPIGCIAQIIDHKGAVLKNGQEGELRIFSENLMQEYYKQQELTENIIKNSWFYSQDIAKYTENGTIQLLGRKQDVIKTATDELIYLSEIQQFISEVDFISDVLVSSYLEEDSEKIVAYVVTKNDPTLNTIELKNKLRKLILKNLGEKKIPNQIKFLAELPYTTNGKLLKKQLI
jgi:acyl-coenzyme A synthetase/AMP-(fatty) acid ligase